MVRVSRCFMRQLPGIVSMMLTVQQLSELLGVPFSSHGERKLHGAGSLKDAREGDLAILSSEKYLNDFSTTQASCVLVGKKIKFPPRGDIAILVVPDPDFALMKALELLAPPVAHPDCGIHSAASIDPTAQIGDNPSIGPNVSIGKRSRIGKNVRIHPGVVISEDVLIGDDCILYPNVVIRERITIGNRVIINAGSVIGTDGFGYKWDGKQHAKIPQIGTVVIEDDVEIGSCVCIDRAKFNETRIGRGTKIDNLVQVGHNVQIGKFAILCGQVGIAGTATIGNGVVLGGQSGVADHVTIPDGVMAAGHTLFQFSVSEKGIYSGWPATLHRKNLRTLAATGKLSDWIDEIKQLRKEIEDLKKTKPAAAP